MKSSRHFSQIRFVLIFVIVAILLVRLFPAFRLLLLVGLFVFSLVAVGAGLWQRRREKNVETNTFVGQTKSKIAACQARATQFRNEAKEIDRDYEDLARQLGRTKDALPPAKAKAEKLLTDLDAERSLRLSKALFFDECVQRLEALLEQHLLHQQLEDKENRLEELRAQDYDDIAEMEGLRYELEQNQVQLDTIVELTHRAAISPDLDHTERLRAELAEIRISPSGQ